MSGPLALDPATCLEARFDTWCPHCGGYLWVWKHEIGNVIVCSGTGKEFKLQAPTNDRTEPCRTK